MSIKYFLNNIKNFVFLTNFFENKLLIYVLQIVRIVNNKIIILLR